MTASHLDPELRSFMETYERLLVLTQTDSVTPSLQPQFVARLLRGRPGELIAIQELYDRIREGDEPVDALREEVGRRMGSLTALLHSAEALQAPEPDRPDGPATPPTPSEGPPAAPLDAGAPTEYAAFVADHGRVSDIARRVGRGSVDRGLRGLGARPADIVAFRLLADRLLDPTVAPDDVIDEIRDRRGLVDELLARAGDPLPGAGETALVARMRAATGAAREPPSPLQEPPLTPSLADQAACDDYLHLYDRLVAATATSDRADGAVDVAAAAALAERVRSRQAPTRVLAIEVERTRPTIEAFLEALAEPAAAGRGPRRFVPDRSNGVGGDAVVGPPGGPLPAKRFTPMVPAARRTTPTPTTTASAVVASDESPIADEPPAARDAGAALPVSPVTLAPPPRRRVFDVRRLLILVMVLAVLDLAALGWWYFTRDDPSSESVAAVAAAATTTVDEPTPPTTVVATTALPSTAPPATATPPRPSTTVPATTAAPPTTAPTTTTPPAPTTVLPEVASGNQCHLVPIISYPSLDGAVRFIEQGDGVRTVLPRNLRAYPSAEVPGYGQVGYLVAAVGATPEEAEQLVVEAADSGFSTRALTLPNPCPAATLSR